MALKENQDILVFREDPVTLDRRVLKEALDRREHLVLPDQREQPVMLADQAPRGPKGSQVLRVQKASKAKEAARARPDPRVLRDLRDRLERGDQVACRGWQDSPDLKDYVELRVKVEPPANQVLTVLQDP